ncbi:hypothetical protein JOQ06_005222, partial [Pogonophryne albipinna]
MVHIQTNPDKHLPSVAFNSPTKQANKKDIYTRRDHFCPRATPQPKDDSIPPPRQTHSAPHQTSPDLQLIYMSCY